MMSLDEAIAHAREVAENWKSQQVNCVTEEGLNKCKECAEDHEQLAAWLEELAEYQKLFDSPEEANELLDQIGGL